MFAMRVEPTGDSSIIVYLGDEISLEIHRHVAALFRALTASVPQGIRNFHPAYTSISIDFDPLQIAPKQVYDYVRRAADRAEHSNATPVRRVEIPVCYDGEFALDAAEVERHTGMSFASIVEAHKAAEYFVYFLGFAPGFAYLGGSDARLTVPRLASPRKHVPAGSVGLAGVQTGVYPNDSPGGWQIIGRTPLRMFDAGRERPSLLETGDSVCFTAVTRTEFTRLMQEVGR